MTSTMVNGRFVHLEPGGFRTYAEEVTKRLPNTELLVPSRFWATGWRGRIWEQIVLPMRCRSRPLFSPASSGPWFHPNHVCVIHDLIPVSHPHLYARRYRASVRHNLGWLCRGATAIVVPSEEVRDGLSQLWPAAASKTFVVNPGVSDRFMVPAPSRAEIGVRPAKPSPLVVGINSNIPRKGGQQTISALVALKRERPSTRTVVFGHDGPTRVFGSTSRPAHDAITDLGTIGDDNVVSLLSEADVFVAMSLSEGFGIPHLEALASKTAVVSTSVPSLKERWGRSCRQVPVNASPQLVAETIVELLDDAVEPVEHRQWPTWDQAAAAITEIISGQDLG